MSEFHEEIRNAIVVGGLVILSCLMVLMLAEQIWTKIKSWAKNNLEKKLIFIMAVCGLTWYGGTKPARIEMTNDVPMYAIKEKQPANITNATEIATNVIIRCFNAQGKVVSSDDSASRDNAP